MKNYTLTRDALEDILRMKQEIRRLKTQVALIESNTASLAGFDVAWGKAAEDIPARVDDEKPSRGRFNLWSIRYLDGEHVLEESTLNPWVYNHSTEKIEEDTQIWAVRITGGDWMYLDLAGTSASLFKTPSTGIPAATHLFAPGKADCERLTFNKDTEIIESYQVIGGPKFEPVYNITGEAIKPSAVIQANRIDGVWFIDVEPCTIPSPP